MQRRLLLLLLNGRIWRRHHVRHALFSDERRIGGFRSMYALTWASVTPSICASATLQMPPAIAATNDETANAMPTAACAPGGTNGKIAVKMLAAALAHSPTVFAPLPSLCINSCVGVKRNANSFAWGRKKTGHCDCEPPRAPRLNYLARRFDAEIADATYANLLVKVRLTHAFTRYLRDRCTQHGKKKQNKTTKTPTVTRKLLEPATMR